MLCKRIGAELIINVYYRLCACKNKITANNREEKGKTTSLNSFSNKFSPIAMSLQIYGETIIIEINNQQICIGIMIAYTPMHIDDLCCAFEFDQKHDAAVFTACHSNS